LRLPQRQQVQARLRILDAPLLQLQVGEVLVGVGVEEALGVIGGVGEGSVHLLVKVAAPVGHLHGEAVAVHGFDDAAGGDLGLEQADGVLLDDETFLHGLEEGDGVARVGVLVPRDSLLSGEQLLVQFRPDDTSLHGLIDIQFPVLHRVNQEPGRCLGLQKDHGGAGPQQVPLHGLIDVQLLLEGELLAGRLHQDAGNGTRAPQVRPHRLHLRHVLHRLLALVQLVVEVLVDDFAFQQLSGRHRGPEALKAHLALFLAFL
ncbi:hypothetical protein N334_06538, partial [Pelecanus crispus]